VFFQRSTTLLLLTSAEKHCINTILYALIASIARDKYILALFYSRQNKIYDKIFRPQKRKNFIPLKILAGNKKV
jgi:hypothetical protein